MFLAYRMYKNGFLPFEGTYLQQPALYLQILNVIDSALAEVEEMKDEDRKRKESRAAASKPKKGIRGKG